MKDNETRKRFELEVNGLVAYADYDLENDILKIKYVFAPPELRGTGAAGNLMKDIMEFVKTMNYKVIPICGYAASWIQRHKEYHSLKV